MIEGGTKIPSTPKLWLANLSSFSSLPSSTSTSFTFFLHLLAAALKKCKGTKDYERLCNWIFVSLGRNNEKKIKMLTDLSSEYSLHHAASILLLLVVSGEPRAATQICELVKAPQKPGGVQLHLAKQRIGLALVMVLVEQGESVSEVGGLISKMVCEAVAEYKECHQRESENIGARRRMVDLVAGWRAGLEEVISRTWKLETGEEMLLGDALWFGTFLDLATEQETVSMCKVIGNLITR